MMQKEGLEPSWYHYHTDLNRARLPIPPFLRTRCILQYLIQNVNTIFQIILKTFGCNCSRKIKAAIL